MCATHPAALKDGNDPDAEEVPVRHISAKASSKTGTPLTEQEMQAAKEEALRWAKGGSCGG